MKINISDFNIQDKDKLIDFLSSGYWEFYREPHLKPEAIIEKIEKGHYTRNGVKTFWIKNDSGTEIGMISYSI